MAASVRLVLLGGFSLRHGDDPVDFPLSAQRLLAFLALQNRPLQRGHVAGALWPRASERRSQASLRTALWRVQHVTGAQTVDASHTRLELGPGVRVDVREALELVEAVDVGDLPPVRRTLALLDADLLPDWDDDWLVPDVERWRQLRLHSLETLAGRFAEAGRFAGAVEAALAAVRAEPLRESANRCLVSVHLAEGNSLEALRAYETFRRALRSDLGMEPSARMALLIDGLSPA
jgi:DNA-binding SARP family transcriptional activator